MKIFNKYTFNKYTFKCTILLLFGTLIFSQYAHGMKKQDKKRLEQKEQLSQKDKPEQAKKIEQITDPYVISDQILPFIEKTSELAPLRQVGITMREGVKHHTEKFRPIKLTKIYPKNIKDFLKWLKQNHKGIDYFVAIDINAVNPKSKNLLASLENKNISDKNFAEILTLIGPKIKELTLSKFDTRKIDLKALSEHNIRKLTLLDFIGSIDPFLASLPKQLEELDISSCSVDITAENLNMLPKTLKVLKVPYIEWAEIKNLDCMPKNLSFLYIKDFEPEMLNHKENQEKILALKQKGVKVLDLYGAQYPTNDQEAKQYKELVDKKVNKQIEDMSDM